MAAAAAIEVRVVPGERRGAFGLLHGGQMLTLAVGTLVGSLVGATSIRVPFPGACAFALLGVVPLGAVLDRGAGESPGGAPAPAGAVGRETVGASVEVGPPAALLLSEAVLSERQGAAQGASRRRGRPPRPSPRRPAGPCSGWPSPCPSTPPRGRPEGR